jgi:kynurenine formamidase
MSPHKPSSKKEQMQGISDEVSAIEDLLSRFSNWGRWGAEDRLGTLNHITDDKRRLASAAVITGNSVSCSRRAIPSRRGVGTAVMQHFMFSTGSEAPARGTHAALEWFGMNIHGLAFTHIDTPSHVFWNAATYNGLPANRIDAMRGDSTDGLDAISDGIVTRGVLFDIPRSMGNRVLGPGERIHLDDLEACERIQNVRIGAGDALLLRVGRDAMPDGGDEGFPGLDPDCIPFLYERNVALICCDGVTDPFGGGHVNSGLSVHTVGLVGMGLWLIDNASLEKLAEVCASDERWDCQFVVAPLRLENATGSPVNPIAIR